MPDAPNREGPQAREPSRCLNGQKKEKDWPKTPSDRQYKRLEKDSDRATTPGVEAVHVLAHLALPGSPQAKQLCHLHTQPSLGQSCHRQRMSCVYMHRDASGVSDSATLWTVACQAGSPGKNTGAYWPILAAIPF